MRELCPVNKLENAINCAIWYHARQQDKGGQPYILHPLSVMFRVRDEGADEATQIVAVLHDILEDTPVTIGILRGAFGDEVASAVAILTRPPGDAYDAYIERIKQHPIARLVKIADLNDNLDPRRHAWAVDDASKAEFARLKARYEKALKTLGADGDCRAARLEAAPVQQIVQQRQERE